MGRTTVCRRARFRPPWPDALPRSRRAKPDWHAHCIRWVLQRGSRSRSRCPGPLSVPRRPPFFAGQVRLWVSVPARHSLWEDGLQEYRRGPVPLRMPVSRNTRPSHQIKGAADPEPACRTGTGVGKCGCMEAEYVHTSIPPHFKTPTERAELARVRKPECSPRSPPA
jgi:hypothetical protein